MAQTPAEDPCDVCPDCFFPQYSVRVDNGHLLLAAVSPCGHQGPTDGTGSSSWNFSGLPQHAG